MTANQAVSKKQRITSYALTALVALFLIFDTTLKLLQLPPAVQATVELGYPASLVLTIGLIQLACLALCLLPRTAILGAILMTGYLGGAIATHLRLGNPLFSHVLFPIYIALLLWGGLYLRDTRLQALIPLRQAD